MIIYKATNKNNGKIYIGQTIGSLGKRITEHLRSTVGFFSRALRKYGRDGFSFEAIETCESKDRLSEREIYWINFFDCKWPRGYNLTDGGERPPSQKGQKRSAATISRMQGNNNALGALRSDETRMKIRAAKIGNKHSLGCKRTDETKAKMSMSLKGKALSFEHKKRLSEAAKIRMKTYPMPWQREKKITVAQRATT